MRIKILVEGFSFDKKGKSFKAQKDGKFSFKVFGRSVSHQAKYPMNGSKTWTYDLGGVAILPTTGAKPKRRRGAVGGRKF